MYMYTSINCYYNCGLVVIANNLLSYIQWYLHIKDTLVSGILLFIKRLSSLWRFKMYCQDTTILHPGS